MLHQGTKLSTVIASEVLSTPRCHSCGADLCSEHGPTGRYCEGCGRTTMSAFAYCGWCGRPLPGADPEMATVATQPHFSEQLTVVADPPAHARTAVLAPSDRITLPTRTHGEHEGAVTVADTAADATDVDDVRPPSRGLCVVVLADADLRPVDVFPLHNGEVFDVDAPYMARPASFTATPGGLRLDDLGSLEGVYVQLEELTRLRSGDRFRVGNHRFQFEVVANPAQAIAFDQGRWGHLRYVTGGTIAGGCDVGGLGVAVCRSAARVTFEQDLMHEAAVCRIVGDVSGIYLDDLTRTGVTYKAIEPGQLIAPGAHVLIDETRVRVDGI